MSLIRNDDLTGFEYLKRVRLFLDVEKDLPDNVFREKKLEFWFFERPVLDQYEMWLGWMRLSGKFHGSDMLVSFLELSSISLRYPLPKGQLEEKLDDLCRRSLSFFDGAVGYPIVISNESLDWLAFESAYEEWGVLAVRSRSLNDDLREYLDAEFIDHSLLREIFEKGGVYKNLAKVMAENHGISLE